VSRVLLEKWRRGRRVRRIVREMAEARREGRGIYLQEWRIGEEQGQETFADEILNWCRTTMGTCRRPFGIDHFDVSIAFSSGGVGVQSLQYAKLRPSELYGDSSLINEIYSAIAGSITDAGSGVVHIAAAMFSWGDAAHAAMPAD
jgi:hypothetical protein